MELEQGDVAQRIGWALRHYGWLVAVVMAAALALGWYIAVTAKETARYQATALVVANTLDVSPTQLPRYAAAVFDSGAVAEGVATELGLALDHRELVPTHISMDPVSDSIAFLVHGYSDGDKKSVRLANTAADHFVRELNRAGPGVGTFSVQDAARVPLEPVAEPSLAMALAVSGMGGMLLAVMLVAFVVWLRRPLLTASEVAGAFGLPLLGTVSVGRDGRLSGSSRTVTSHPLVVRTLARGLESTGHDGFVLLGEPRSKKARMPLLVPLREELRPNGSRGDPPSGAHDRPLSNDGSHAGGTQPRAARAARPGPRPPSHRPARLLPSRAHHARTGAMADASTTRSSVPVTLVEDWAADRTDACRWGVIVVAEQGTPTRRLSELVAEWRSEDAVGVVMLRTRHQCWGFLTRGR